MTPSSFYSAGESLYVDFIAESSIWGGRGRSNGGSTTIGSLARKMGIKLGDLDSFIQLGAVLSLRQQLINAGWDNPENIFAKFDDWSKLVSSKGTSLNELYTKTNNGKSKLKFVENSSLNTPGKAVFNIIEVNMSENKNLLEYAFTIGHEMTHSFTDLHFQNKFFELYRNSDGQYMRDNTYTYFKEVIGIGWEINHGSTRYGDLTGEQAVRKYYKHIDVRAMDKVDPYLKQLLREWHKMYNSK